MIKYCPNCHKEFKAPPSGQKYCCYECYVWHQIMETSVAEKMIRNYRIKQDKMDAVFNRLRPHTTNGRKKVCQKS